MNRVRCHQTEIVYILSIDAISPIKRAIGNQAGHCPTGQWPFFLVKVVEAIGIYLYMSALVRSNSTNKYWAKCRFLGLYK